MSTTTELSLFRVLQRIKVRDGSKFNPAHNDKYKSLKDLDFVMDAMSSRRASNRGEPNCSCNSNCVGHSAFYTERPAGQSFGAMSLGQINAFVASIKACPCDAQTTCSGNVSVCTCDADCTCNSDYGCGTHTSDQCDAYTVSGCMCEGDIYNECESDWWPPGACYGSHVAGCSCNPHTFNGSCACNSDWGSTCSCQGVCSCNGHFA